MALPVLRLRLPAPRDSGGHVLLGLLAKDRELLRGRCIAAPRGHPAKLPLIGALRRAVTRLECPATPLPAKVDLVRVVSGDGPEEWVEIRIRAVSLPTRRYRRSSIFDITIRLDQDSRFTLQSILKPGSDFRRDYRDIRVERRTVRTVATDWEPVTGDELPA